MYGMGVDTYLGTVACIINSSIGYVTVHRLRFRLPVRVPCQPHSRPHHLGGHSSHCQHCHCHCHCLPSLPGLPSGVRPHRLDPGGPEEAERRLLRQRRLYHTHLKGTVQEALPVVLPAEEARTGADVKRVELEDEASVGQHEEVDNIVLQRYERLNARERLLQLLCELRLLRNQLREEAAGKVLCNRGQLPAVDKAAKLVLRTVRNAIVPPAERNDEGGW